MANVKKRRVDIKGPEFKRGIHTAYLPDSSLGHDDAGNAKGKRTVAFYRGRADVEETTARQLRDAGHIK